jgi:glutaredoxin/glutathione-dependent peroxiredoxin
MSIKVGDALPEGTFTRMTASGPAPISSRELFEGKKVIVFGVPGAFTPTCSKQHLPGYLANYDALKAKGVDTIACLAVNDVFVMDAWARASDVGDRVLMLADGNAAYTCALGLEFDLSGFGMGTRSKRFSLVAENGIVTQLNVEAGPGVSVSGADAIGCQL